MTEYYIKEYGYDQKHEYYEDWHHVFDSTEGLEKVYRAVADLTRYSNRPNINEKHFDVFSVQPGQQVIKVPTQWKTGPEGGLIETHWQYRVLNEVEKLHAGHTKEVIVSRKGSINRDTFEPELEQVYAV